MFSAVRQGEGFGAFSWTFPHPMIARRAWVALAILCLGLTGWSPMAQASTYRCSGTHGETVYTRHPAGYAHCQAIHVGSQKRISRYTGSGSTRGDAHADAVVLRGSVYRVVGPDGSIEYTNVRPGHHRGHQVTRLFTYIDTCAACSLHSAIDWSSVPLNLTAYGTAVRKAAQDSGVSPAFLRAVIHAESAYDPNALSSAGAQGLMQLMPATASSMGVDDAFDAKANIQGGARYLAKLLKDFHGDHKLAAAAYNAGPNAVRKYDGVPPYAETEVYVKRVATLYQRYAKALGGQVLVGAGS